MSARVSLRPPGELLDRVDRAAEEAGISRTAYVRKALELLLEGAWAAEGQRPYEQVRDLAGVVSDGPPDLGSEHRRYLLERIRDRR